MTEQITYLRPRIAPILPSVYHVIRNAETFEIIADEELSDRDKEDICQQFSRHQDNLLDELLGSNLEVFTDPAIAIRTLISDSYNLPVPSPITSETLFLREEFVRVIGSAKLASILNEKVKRFIQACRAKQMKIGVWLYRLPDGWVEKLFL